MLRGPRIAALFDERPPKGGHWNPDCPDHEVLDMPQRWSKSRCCVTKPDDVLSVSRIDNSCVVHDGGSQNFR